jgi:F0F1-type ATP synthase assembly protein I
LRSGDRDRRGFQAIGEYGRFIHLGTQFCLLMVGGVLGGWWLDKKFDLLPLFTVLGACLGTAVGIYTLYRAVFDRKSR